MEISDNSFGLRAVALAVLTRRVLRPVSWFVTCTILLIEIVIFVVNNTFKLDI
jgi:hypothetical protein